MEYNKYSNTTQKYMKIVEKFLRKKYGKVQPEWNEQLHMLANNINIYEQCENDIIERGLTVVAKNGAPVRNPSVQLMLDIQKQIIKLVSEFGLSPKAVASISEPTEDNNDLSELMMD